MKAGSPSLRLATAHDAQQLAAMRWSFHSEDNEPVSQTLKQFTERFQKFFAEALTSGRWFVWVADQDGKIISHVYVYVVPKVPRPSRTTDSWGYVTNVYTDPSHRGKGVGSKLMDAATDWAMKERLELLIVWPSDDSADFYRRSGFEKSVEIFERILVDDEDG